MNEFFKKPTNELGKLKRTETNIQDYLDEPKIDQNDRIALRPINESSALKLESDIKMLSETIQSSISVKKNNKLGLIQHPD